MATQPLEIVEDEMAFFELQIKQLYANLRWGQAFCFYMKLKSDSPHFRNIWEARTVQEALKYIIVVKASNENPQETS